MSEVVLDLRTPEVIIRPMLTLDRAIDDFLGDCRRRRWSERSIRSYSYTLYQFADRLPVDYDVSKVTTDDVRRFLATKANLSRGSLANIEAHLASWLKWLVHQRKIVRDPMAELERTKRAPAQDLDVVSVSTADVTKLLLTARPGPERNAIAILAYLGPRRHAVASLRLRDYDRELGEIKFREKGDKVIWKPIPDELRVVLEASIARGEIRPAPEDYLVPPEGYLQRKGNRDDRVIYRLVKKVAHRAGVDAHVHALRAAFAVFYLEQNGRDTYGLQQLLGHTRMSTTEIYLRRYDKRTAMQPVRNLSWAGAGATPGNAEAPERPQIAAFWLEASPSVGAEGFEPSSDDSLGGKRAGDQQAALEPLTRRLEAERARSAKPFAKREKRR